ncbi:MAG TPA: thiamine diphosphokinase [Candidatus Angelobacter sp.]|nr:thiamine diphosphokinase [Candidatus Angelobacter sp.]
MPHAVILANGTPPSPSLLNQALAGAALFLCADGGANAARALRVKPAAIVGDFDSVTPETLAHFQGVPQIRDTDLERTDTEKAIDYALAQGHLDSITLLGASAGRLDHVVGHLGLLRKYAARIRLVIQDDDARAYVATQDVTLDAPRGTVISFFAIGAPVEHLTTENLRFPLTDVTLDLGVQDSVSNVVDATPAKIRFRRGHLLVIEAKNP